VAVLVFRHQQFVYSNMAARQLAERLRAKYRTELTVVLRDHLKKHLTHVFDNVGVDTRTQLIARIA
jgi:hypothetical protein